jgi:hypothetical protein
MLCSNATILRVRSDPGWDIAHVMQRSEDTKKLDASYFTMPPEALIFRKMGANVFMDAGELARAQWFWEQRPKKLVLSTEKALGILIFYGSFWLAAMCLDQQAVGMTVLLATACTLTVIMPAWAVLDALRLARWTSDYRSAILRLRQTVHR